MKKIFVPEYVDYNTLKCKKNFDQNSLNIQKRLLNA